MKNYYDLLEVSPLAGQKEIDHAYNRQKQSYSGDSFALYSLLTKEECEEMVAQIEEAYAVLGDLSKRKAYNEARGIETPDGVIGSSKEEQQSLTRPLNEADGLARKVKATAKLGVPNRQKYELNYKIDPDLEREIESCQEFTGEFLKRIREYKGVSIERLADMTRISKTHIRNLEESNRDRLPADVYTRGFAYQYAKCLKLNPELVASSYILALHKHQRAS